MFRRSVGSSSSRTLLCSSKTPNEYDSNAWVLRHDQLARVVAERFGLDYVDLAVYDLYMLALERPPYLYAPRATIPPRRSRSASATTAALLLAMADPTNVLTIDDVRR